jgi:flagella basal body P-ring formation protein FlgA
VISLGKLLLFSCVVCCFFNPVYGVEDTIDIQRNVYQRIRDKLIVDYPELIPKTIQIVIKNKGIFDELPIGTVDIYLDISPKARLLGTTILNMNCLDTYDDIIKVKRLSVRTDGMGKLFKSTHLIKKYVVIKEADVEIVRESIISKPVNRVKNIEELIGKESRFVIPKGAIFTKPLIRLVPDVKNGSIVNLMIVKPGIRLNIQGKVLDDGRKGDIVRVQSLMTNKKLLKGEIVDSQNIRVISSTY